ncbi:RES family NAD+ phosphorylase [Rhizobiaceae bacterium n13]|uniref:RES family NAD+ phosphorylase n=1 Tax=Ferirhizobium litorale TaxID=2927786 RepID=A0AAE3U1L8_9HYPH|nr:RES family NAD+ phosphorylase [Fererhizobium litorale]MDI7861866.1 RES family NAD+ phosphorylase [Fererhizobium litorale]MDI7921792.1 RES family NAD+ phosphorylase [Fererhizobium litorale]
MRLWRLSGTQHARSFDGGYGLLFDGRWNTAGWPVTYCATSPSLCVLEKLVHVEDPALLPDLTMVVYDFPDDLGIDDVPLDTLPGDWRQQEAMTQEIGSRWLASGTSPLIRVPSAIVALPGSPDLNLMINHRHPDAGRIAIAKLVPFRFDPRLL